MTDKKSREENSPSVPRGPDQSEGAEASVPMPAEGASPKGATPGKAEAQRRPAFKFERFLLRQSGFTVPKPSYLRHGDIDALPAPETASGDAESQPEPGHEFDVDATDANAIEPATVSKPLVSRSTRRWIYVVLSLVFYLVYRMHVLSR